MTTLDLPKLILDYLGEQGRNRTRIGEAAVSLSASGSCSRQVSYLRHKPELAEPVEAKAMARFELGHAVHAAVASILGQSKLKIVGVEEAVWISLASHPGRTIPGHVDMVVEHEGKRIPIEVKSCGAWEWKVVAGLKVPSDTAEGNISWAHGAQNLSYQRALGGGAGGGAGAERGYMLYWCVEKDKEAEQHPTFPFFAVEVPFEERGMGAGRAPLESRARLHAGKPAGSPVPADRGNGTIQKSGRWVLPFPCNYCAFVKECWPDAAMDPEGPRARTFVVPEPKFKIQKADVF